VHLKPSMANTSIVRTCNNLICATFSVLTALPLSSSRLPICTCCPARADASTATRNEFCKTCVKCYDVYRNKTATGIHSNVSAAASSAKSLACAVPSSITALHSHDTRLELVAILLSHLRHKKDSMPALCAQVYVSCMGDVCAWT
jgi:hypothetical protein